MSIFITGDVHGEWDVWKLLDFNKDNRLNLTKKDYLIICGDFGFIWSKKPDKTEVKWLNWFDKQSYTTLFVDGNHSNHDRLKNYPVSTWNGGKAHKINDSVIHLMRGQVFDIEGHKFFTMGGATSHDIEHRTKGVSWWANEVPSFCEREEAIVNLDKNDWKVDYVITHDCPTDIVKLLLPSINLWERAERQPNEYNDWLREISDKLAFKQWFHGHYHMDIKLLDGRFQCVYDDIVQLC